MTRMERDPHAFESPLPFTGYALSILYMTLGGLGLSVDFEEGKYLLILGGLSLPAWNHLSRSKVFRKILGVIRWTLNLAITPAITLYLIKVFLGGLH